MKNFDFDLGEIGIAEMARAEIEGNHYFELDPYDLACVIVGLVPAHKYRMEYARGDIELESGELKERRENYGDFCRQFNDRNGIPVLTRIVEYLATGDIHLMGLGKGLLWAIADPVIRKYVHPRVREQAEQLGDGKHVKGTVRREAIESADVEVCVLNGIENEDTAKIAESVRDRIRAISDAPAFLERVREEENNPDYQPTVDEWINSPEMKSACKSGVPTKVTVERWLKEWGHRLDWDRSGNSYNQKLHKTKKFKTK